MKETFARNRVVITLVLLLLAVGVTRYLYARSVSAPGIMDALYNYHVAVSLFEGKGFTVDYVWNFLQRPTKAAGHFSHGYWPPGMSVLLMVVFYILGPTIEAGQILMAIFSAGLVAVTFWLGLRLFEDYRVALYASLFIMLNPVVVYHSCATDSTVPMALLVNLALIALSYCKSGYFKPYVLAMAAGTICPYLRVDGFILPLFVLAHYLWFHRKEKVKNWTEIGILLAIWLLPQVPWALRNYMVFGTFWPATPLTSALIPSPDDMFKYNIRVSLRTLFGAGFSSLMAMKLDALWQLVYALVFKQTIILFVFGFIALPSALKNRRLHPFIGYSVTLLLLLPLFFSCHRLESSFLHSVVALYPFLACLSVQGFRDLMIDLSTKALRRDLPNLSQYLRTAQEAGIHAILLVTLAVFSYKVHPQRGDIARTFRHLDSFYGAIEERLADMAIPLDTPLMATDPFFTYHYCRRPTVIIPRDSNPSALESAAARYKPRYLISVEFSHQPQKWDKAEYRVGKMILKEVRPRRLLSESRDTNNEGDKKLKVPDLDILGFQIYEIFWLKGQ